MGRKVVDVVNFHRVKGLELLPSVSDNLFLYMCVCTYYISKHITAAER